MLKEITTLQADSPPVSKQLHEFFSAEKGAHERSTLLLLICLVLPSAYLILLCLFQQYDGCCIDRPGVISSVLTYHTTSITPVLLVQRSHMSGACAEQELCSCKAGHTLYESDGLSAHTAQPVAPCSQSGYWQLSIKIICVILCITQACMLSPQLDQPGLHMLCPHALCCCGDFRCSVCHLGQAQRERRHWSLGIDSKQTSEGQSGGVDRSSFARQTTPTKLKFDMTLKWVVQLKNRMKTGSNRTVYAQLKGVSVVDHVCLEAQTHKTAELQNYIETCILFVYVCEREREQDWLGLGLMVLVSCHSYNNLHIETASKMQVLVCRVWVMHTAPAAAWSTSPTLSNVTVMMVFLLPVSYRYSSYYVQWRCRDGGKSQELNLKLDTTFILIC